MRSGSSIIGLIFLFAIILSLFPSVGRGEEVFINSRLNNVQRGQTANVEVFYFTKSGQFDYSDTGIGYRFYYGFRNRQGTLFFYVPLKFSSQDFNRDYTGDPVSPDFSVDLKSYGIGIFGTEDFKHGEKGGWVYDANFRLHRHKKGDLEALNLRFKDRKTIDANVAYLYQKSPRWDFYGGAQGEITFYTEYTNASPNKQSTIAYGPFAGLDYYLFKKYNIGLQMGTLFDGAGDIVPNEYTWFVVKGSYLW